MLIRPKTEYIGLNDAFTICHDQDEHGVAQQWYELPELPDFVPAFIPSV